MSRVEGIWGTCLYGNHRDCAVPSCQCISTEHHAGPHDKPARMTREDLTARITGVALARPFSIRAGRMREQAQELADALYELGRQDAGTELATVLRAWIGHGATDLAELLSAVNPLIPGGSVVYSSSDRSEQ